MLKDLKEGTWCELYNDILGQLNVLGIDPATVMLRVDVQYNTSEHRYWSYAGFTDRQQFGKVGTKVIADSSKTVEGKDVCDSDVTGVPC